MNLSNHAIDRGGERMGLSLKPFEKMAEKALATGVKHSDAKGRLKKYFDSLYFKYGTANNVRIYGEFVYLFCNEVLITVLNLPNDLKQHAKKINANNRFNK